jgi:hypothetical protein
MNVDVTESTTGQQIPVDKFQNFFVRRHNGGRKITQRTQYLAAIAQMSDGDFSNHEGMRQDFDPTTEAATWSRSRAADGRSKSRNRRGSPRALTRSRTKLRFCSPKPCQSACRLPFNEGLERLLDNRGLFINAGILLRSGEKLVIYRNGGFHRFQAPSASKITSFEAAFHGLRVALESLCNCE